MRLELGTAVRCGDEVVGELGDVVIDPTTKKVTHLVVRPHHDEGEGRLVPVELAADGGDGKAEIILSCTADEVRQLPSVQAYAYLRLGQFPVTDPDWDVGVNDVLAMPYYGGTGLGSYAGDFDDHVGVTYDRVPKGEVEVRRSSTVITSDGEYVGKVDGFVVDDDQHITHFVLERGHLWGKRDVSVPIGSVAKVESDAVTLGLSKDEVGALPAVKVHRW